MDIRPIRTDEDHQSALREIDRLWGAPRGTPEGDKIDILATLVEAYESEHHPVPDADPVDMLHFAIEDMGRSQTELAELLGSRARASEILNRKRHLTLAQIRLISEAWHLPIGTLAAPYRLDKDAA
jgi:HTH-type transcriptional regulator/antitoxin HigA